MSNGAANGASAAQMNEIMQAGLAKAADLLDKEEFDAAAAAADPTATGGGPGPGSDGHPRHCYVLRRQGDAAAVHGSDEYAGWGESDPQELADVLARVWRERDARDLPPRRAGDTARYRVVPIVPFDA